MTDLIDAHVHLWNPSLHRHPWLDDEPALHRPFGLADLDPSAYDLSGIVVVEAGCRANQTGAEVEWIEKLAADAPVIRGVVAQAPLELGSAVAPALAELAAKPLVVGVRRNVQDEAPGFLSDPDFVRGVQSLAGTGLTFDACIRHHQLAELTALVDRCPDVTFVLDHLAKPAIATRTWQPWRDDLAALAERPNVVAKLSGLTTEADRSHWRTADVDPYLRHALDVFMPRRCMFGSDWPVATLATRYVRWLRLIVELVEELSPSERGDVLGGTTARIYGLAS